MQSLAREQTLAMIYSAPEAAAQLIESLFAELQQIHERLLAPVGQLAQNSHKNHKLPSSDGLKNQPHSTSLRRTTGKKRSGQEGHASAMVRKLKILNAFKIIASNTVSIVTLLQPRCLQRNMKSARFLICPPV